MSAYPVISRYFDRCCSRA
ncbi:hypothetical protein C5167_008651 [Papaver somniferum]|uniref:Uncharacterized protein n=1 Tax=Papaver somniferum TaxID=3469 RepID=A0A4Y7JY50_PAPSO|nr:hypothetical protein C5167_008651 [Papaver somniferum]